MFIDRKHAVGIAIEGRTQVGPYLTYLPLHIYHVLRLDGAGRVVRETAVKLKVQRHEFAREMQKDPWYDHARHTIARVNNHFERFDLAHIDKREDVIDIIIGNITLYYRAFMFWLCESSAHCQVTDISQA